MKKKKSYWAMAKDVIRKSDIVLEVVDARFPGDSRNFVIERLVRDLNKKLIIVINKVDLVPEFFVKKVTKEFSKEFPTTYISAQKRHGTKNLFNIINKLRAGKSVKIGVVGYPNVGKSMIINVLKGRHSASTAATPGHTKGIQLLRIAGNMMLVDTPGVTTIKGKRSLASKCAIDVNSAEDPIELVESLIAILAEKKPKAFVDRYGVPVENPSEFIAKIAKKYNLIMKGGMPDIRRAAIKIYTDWLKGRLKVYWL
ncbi:MAG TPA: GTPase RsgA [Candidatus Woesearchaeota archaeon]|nr:GTPase RsgA [Candidatus Woesearchaeota archaeon]